MNIKFFIGLISLFCFEHMSFAGIPSTLTYQGSLKQNGVSVNGTYPMEFRITDSGGSSVYWTSGPQSVTVTAGLYKVDLAPTGVNWNAISPYIETKVNGNLLLPREKLTGTPYALVAQKVSGTTTNDNAAPGYVGEYVESVVGPIAASPSGQYGDAAKILLTAGDWDVSLIMTYRFNGAVFTAYDMECAITPTPGNSSAGFGAANEGIYYNGNLGAFSSWSYYTMAVPAYRVNFSGAPKYYYAKVYFSNYTTGTPLVYARISARRVR